MAAIPRFTHAPIVDGSNQLDKPFSNNLPRFRGRLFEDHFVNKSGVSSAPLEFKSLISEERNPNEDSDAEECFAHLTLLTLKVFY